MGWFAMLCCVALVAGSPTEVSQRIIGTMFCDVGEESDYVNMVNPEDYFAVYGLLTVDADTGRLKLEISTPSDTPKTLYVAEKGEKPDEIDDTTETDRFFRVFRRTYRDWFGAKEKCEEWGGHLAIPNTEAKMQLLTQMLNKYIEVTGDFSSAFLGFTDLEDEGNFVTIFGKPVFRTQDSVWSPHWFRNDQPDDDKSWTKDGEDCGSLYPNGGLNDVPCRYSLPFICEKEKGDGDEMVLEDRTRHAVRINAVQINVEDYDSYETSDEDGLGDDEDEAARQTVVEDKTRDLIRVDKDEDEDTLHLFPRSNADWHDAEKACKGWGGHLAIPDSEAKVLKMAKMLASPEKNPEQFCAFLGFNDKNTEGEFVTIFGKPVFNSNESWSPHWFNPDQPDDDKAWTKDGEDCGSIHPNGGLNDVPCHYRLPYFCEKSRVQDSEPKPALVQDASIVHEDLDSLALFDRDDLTWFEAKDACKKWGGYLATPDSRAKVAFMTSEMKAREISEAFLGFSDQDEEGNFVTIYGTPVFSTLGWSPSWWQDDQPDDGKDWFENCGSIMSSGGLNDILCMHHLPFFCEIKPKPVDQEGTEKSDTGDNISESKILSFIESLRRLVVKDEELNMDAKAIQGLQDIKNIVFVRDLITSKVAETEAKVLDTKLGLDNVPSPMLVDVTDKMSPDVETEDDENV